jgi:hypothetical protein
MGIGSFGNAMFSQVQWLMPVILATQEATKRIAI